MKPLTLRRIKFAAIVLAIYILIFISLIPFGEGWLAGIFVFLMTLPVALIKLSVPNGLLQSDDFIEKVIYYGADFIYIFAIGYLISHFFVRDD